MLASFVQHMTNPDIITSCDLIIESINFHLGILQHVSGQQVSMHVWATLGNVNGSTILQNLAIANNIDINQDIATKVNNIMEDGPLLSEVKKLRAEAFLKLRG